MAEKMTILWFPQSLQISAWIVPEIGNVNFFSAPVIPIIWTFDVM